MSVSGMAFSAQKLFCEHFSHFFFLNSFAKMGGGAGLTHAKIFWWICRSIPKTLLRYHSTQIMIINPPKSEHFSPKIDHHQQLLNIYPKSNHSLPKMVIYALFTSKCRESHLRAFVIISPRVPGLG